MDRKRIAGASAALMAVMLVFTLLSRALDGAAMARVETVRIGTGEIRHTVSGSGQAKAGKEIAVYTESGQRVKEICVEEGQAVEKGETLFRVDMDELAEQILALGQEVEKLRLQNQDAANADALAQKSQETARRRAREDYDAAAANGEEAVQKAKADWDAAQAKLQAFLEKAGAGSPGDESGDAAGNSGNESGAGTGSLGDESGAAAGDSGNESGAGAGSLGDESGDAAGDSGNESGAGKEDSGKGESLEDGADAPLRRETERRADKAGRNNGDSPDTGGSNADGSDTDGINAGSLDAGGSDADGSDTDGINAGSLDAGAILEGSREMAGMERTAGDQDYEARKATLEQEVEEAKAAYEAAVSERDSAVKSAMRAMEDADAQPAPDSVAKQGEIALRQQELALGKLQALQEAEGKVAAPANGVVTRIDVATGDFTTDGTAVLLADVSGGCRLVVSVDRSEEDYVAAGCEVTIRQPGSSEEITGYTVSGVAENKTDRTLLDVSVDLPEGVLEPGMAADVEIVHKSENYAAILPIQAVHEGQNRYYVLALQEERSVLGTELVAKRYEVEVLEKNSEYAAIADGALTADQEIVSSSTRAIGDGSRVRRDEE